MALHIKGQYGMNGTKIVFDTCAGMVVAPLDNSVEKIAVEIRRTITIKLPDDARRRMAAQ
jgi:hypothetical protein